LSLKKASFSLVAKTCLQIYNTGNGSKLKLIQSVVPAVTKYLDNSTRLPQDGTLCAHHAKVILRLQKTVFSTYTLHGSSPGEVKKE